MLYHSLTIHSPFSTFLFRPLLQSADVERVEEQVLHLRSQVVVELESRAARNQQRLTQLQAELALEREEHEGVSKVILECIMGALHALADHKEEVKRRLGTCGGGRGRGEGEREGGRSTYKRT